MEKIVAYCCKLRAQCTLNHLIFASMILGVGILGYCCLRFGVLLVIKGLILIGLLLAFAYGVYRLVCYCQKHPDRVNRARLVDLFHSCCSKIQAVKNIAIFQKKAQAADLPWFLLCGPGKSGKSTLLSKSEIPFSQTEASHAQLQHDLELWFSDQAVVIDTHAASENWHNVMRHLKKLKVHTRLKGIVLTLGCDQLTQESDNAINLDTIRVQLDALYRYTGRQLPVYLIVTQCDLLDGFTALFSQLDRQAKQQIFGFSLGGTRPLLSQCENGLERLSQRLLNRLINQMHMIAEPSTKLAGFAFINQFRRLGKRLQKRVMSLQQTNMYQEALRFKGVYFTSAGAKESEDPAYFTHDLLTRHIFLQQDSAPFTQTKQKKNVWIGHAKKAAWVAGGCGAFLLMAQAYHRQTILLDQSRLLAIQGKDLMQHQVSETEQYAYLEAVARHVYQLRHFKHDYYGYQRLGFNDSQKELPTYERLLAKVLNQTLYHPVQQFLIQALTQKSRLWSKGDEKQRAQMRGDYYTQLKLYLMLNFPSHLDSGFAQIELEKIWRRLRKDPYQSNAQSSLSSQAMIESYVDYLKRLGSAEQAKLAHIHTDLIRRARHDLKTFSGIHNMYAAMLNQQMERFGILDEHDFFDEDNMDVWRVGHPVSRLFTKEAYINSVKPQFLAYIKENPRQDWVIHAPLSQLKDPAQRVQHGSVRRETCEKYLKEFNTLYFSRYFEAWLQAIGSIKMISFTSYEDAAQQLRLLYQTNGSFQTLLTRVHQNLNLSTMLETKAFQRVPEHLQRRFSALESFSQATQHAIQLAPYLKQLAVLQQDIERLSIGGELSDEAEHYALRVLDEQSENSELLKTTQQVDQLVNGFNDLYTRQALRKLLLSPAQEAYRAVLYEASRGLQKEWQQTVIVPYKEKLISHFPFNHSGPDADLAEFSTFFRPENGTFAQFLNRIKPFLLKKGRRYTSRAWLGVTLPLQGAFLQQLNAFEQISNSLFASGQGQLSLKFMIYPIPTPGIQEILLVSNGQSYPYRNGPQEWVSLNWPKQDAMDNETFIRITRAWKNRQSIKEFQGTWGLFHLLQSADEIVKTQRGYRLKWVFKKQGDTKVVQMLIASRTEYDPFQSLLLNPLELSETIIDFS